MATFEDLQKILKERTKLDGIIYAIHWQSHEGEAEECTLDDVYASFKKDFQRSFNEDREKLDGEIMDKRNALYSIDIELLQ